MVSTHIFGNTKEHKFHYIFGNLTEVVFLNKIRDPNKLRKRKEINLFFRDTKKSKLLEIEAMTGGGGNLQIRFGFKVGEVPLPPTRSWSSIDLAHHSP